MGGGADPATGEAKEGEAGGRGSDGGGGTSAAPRRGAEAESGHGTLRRSHAGRSPGLSHTSTGRRRGDMVPRAVLLLLEDLSVEELSVVSKRCAELIAEAEEAERE